MQITITLTTMLAWAAAEAATAYNASLPRDENGAPIGALSAEAYAQERMLDVARSWAQQRARISIASGIDRLTGAEFTRIKAARAASTAVGDAVRPIFESKSVELAGDLWINGVNALAGAGLLDTPTQARVSALLAPPQPGETRVE